MHLPWAISFFARNSWLAVVADSLFALRLTGAELPPPAAVDHGRARVVAGLTVVETWGDARESAEARGELLHDQVAPLLRLVRWQPQLLLARAGRRLSATLAAVSADDRVAIGAMAARAGVDGRDLLAVNAMADVCCSALASPAGDGQPLRLARNLDFFPAGALGRRTVLDLVREDGRRPYAAIGWPGSLAVMSGMNDAGLCGCVLLNHGGRSRPGGEPLGLRLRAILQHESTVAGAIARFAAEPVACGHYLMLADADTAAVIWQGADGALHRDDPISGWLAVTNGRRVAGQPDDARGHRLQQVIASAPSHPDDGWMRRVPSATFMPGINAQAMVFEPATRTLWLATGSASQPAARQAWRRIPLAGVFAGAPVTDLPVAVLPAVEPLTHYAEAVADGAEFGG